MLPNMVTVAASVVGLAATTMAANATVNTVYEFPASTYVENIAVRSNGQLLVNLLTAPELWLVDPAWPGQAILVHEFAGSNALCGIAEYEPDVFAVIAGNVTLATGDGVVGSWSIYSIDLAGANITSNASITAKPPTVTKIADIDAATLLNGMAVLSGDEKSLLIAGDVKTGTIYSVDIETGDYAVAINNTYTATATEYGLGTSGTDGVQILDDVLYFTNIAQGYLYRVALNTTDGTPAGEFETVSQIMTSNDQWDDFTFDAAGNVYMTAGGANTIEKINVQTGAVELIAGDLNSTCIAEPSSAKFGRRTNDKNVLYVTTAGGLLAPVNGDTTVGGQVLAINTGKKSSC